MSSTHFRVPDEIADDLRRLAARLSAICRRRVTIPEVIGEAIQGYYQDTLEEIHAEKEEAA